MLTLEDLAELAEVHRDALGCPIKSFALGATQFGGETASALMGVVNRSPDSWYRESVCLTTERAIERARLLRNQGAVLVDIGGESTLPDAERVDGDGQTELLLPLVEAIAGDGGLVSVETYHPDVAATCLEAGASVINLTGNEAAEEIYPLVAKHDAAAIICFVQGPNVREVEDLDLSNDPMPILTEYFGREIERARTAGVQRIFIDPGLGFYYRNLEDSAERVRHQMKVFLNTFRLRQLGWPVCHALPHAFEYFGEEVRTAESFFAVLAALGKTSLFRTHEVPKVRAVLETLRAY